MAERKHKKYRRVDSAEVQGDGSYVVIQSPGFDVLGDLLSVANIVGDKGKPDELDLSKISGETMQAIFGLLEKTVVEWDWVNDNGDPLPQPREDPEVIRRELSQEEQTFLVAHLDFGGVDPKV